MRIEFTVYGEAKPQGSKIPQVIRRKGGAVVMKNGSPLVVTRDDNPGTKGWRNIVAHEARRVYDGDLIRGPIRLSLVFFRPRPRGHYGTGRNASTIRAGASLFPTSKPDVLKLGRAVEDALTGVVWKDDSQVVTENLQKRWGEPARVEVVIEELAADVAGGEG